MATRIPRSGQRGGSSSPRHREWVIASDVTAINGVIDGVVALCTGAGFSARHCRFNIPVALTEALSNAIMRGNGNDSARRVHIRSAIEHRARAASRTDGGLVRGQATLVVEVTDEGEGFDIATAGSRPDQPDWLEREDGRGVFLMQSLMDRVECTRGSGLPGNTVRLVLHRT